jgi:hypothetical protein
MADVKASVGFDEHLLDRIKDDDNDNDEVLEKRHRALGPDPEKACT